MKRPAPPSSETKHPERKPPPDLRWASSGTGVHLEDRRSGAEPAPLAHGCHGNGVMSSRRTLEHHIAWWEIFDRLPREQDGDLLSSGQIPLDPVPIG
jgi:hypothetical protein